MAAGWSWARWDIPVMPTKYSLWGQFGKLGISTAIIPKDLNTDIVRGHQTAIANLHSAFSWVLAVGLYFIAWIFGQFLLVAPHAILHPPS